MMKIKSLNKNIPLRFILTSFKNYRQTVDKIGNGIVRIIVTSCSRK